MNDPEPTSVDLDPDEAGDLDEREMLFNAYLDGDLSDEKEEAFDERLASDPEFREAYDDFAEVVDGVRNLPYEFAPDDFTDRVRSKIRTRSRGQFFGEQFLTGHHVPYEVVAVVMFVIMASAYLMTGMQAARQVQSSGERELELPPAAQETDDSPPESPDPDSP